MAEVEPREVVYQCARHPNVETVLRCGRCETPICPKCLVYTPVGARCPDCGKPQPSPIYQVSPNILLRAIGGGIGLTIAAAIAWAIVAEISGLRLFLLVLIAALGIGYGVGEGVSRVARYKRGPVLSIIAGLPAAAGYLLGVSLSFFLAGLPFLVAFQLAIRQSLSLVALVALIASVAMAVSRVR